MTSAPGRAPGTSIPASPSEGLRPAELRARCDLTKLRAGQGRMISKTAMLELVKGFRAGKVERALASNPALFDYRDERGRNWLHVCCGQKVARAKVPDSIKTAAVL